MAINAAQLRAFHAVASTGQFTAAARTLHLTQSTLSNQVAALEARFEVRLFDRTPRGASLTPAGVRLYELTQRQHALSQQAEQLLNASDTLSGGFIRVGADAPQLVMPVLAALSRAHAEVQLSLQMGNADAMLERLAEGRADVAIVGRNDPDPRYSFEPLVVSPLVAFVSRSHRFAARHGITLAELSREPLVLREPGSETRRMLDRAFEARALKVAAVFEVESREAVKEAVAAGLGAGVVSSAELNADPRVVSLTITDAELRMTEYVACLARRRHLSVVQAFQDAAREAVAALTVDACAQSGASNSS